MRKTNFKKRLPCFISYLKCQEYAASSVKSYRRDILGLFEFLDRLPSETLKKEHLIAYKETLTARLRPVSANRNIASINKFLDFLGMSDFKLKTLKIQEQTSSGKELTEKEFNKLLQTAFHTGKTKIALIMLTLACTGIRIGELKFITVEAVMSGAATINNKGTIRTIVLQRNLQKTLLSYCKDNSITDGAVFTGSSGNPISRSYVARAMKEVAKKCGIDPARVFPHNFRHYFARCFLDCGNPLSDLADILGHKNINTTRRYLKTNAEAKQRQLSKLKAVQNWKDCYGFSSARAG